MNMMSLHLLTVLLGMSDVAANAILSAAYREKGVPQAVDVALATARLAIVMLVLVVVSDASFWRVVAAFALVLSAGPALVEGFVDGSTKSDEHVVAGAWVALVFAVMDAALLLVLRSVAFANARERMKNNSQLGEGKQRFVAVSDVESPLLAGHDEGEDNDHDIAGEDKPDAYKGQGATLRRLMALAYPERFILGVATVALFISSAASIVTPALFGRLIQTISVTNDEDELNKTTLLLVLLFVVTSVFSLIRGALYTLAGERLVARFRVRLFQAILNQDIEFFDRNQSGELQSRLSNDTSAIQNAVTVNVSMSLRWFVSAIVSLIVIFVISWKLTLVMLSVVPALFVGARFYGNYMKDLSKKYQDALAKASETAAEALGNIRTVRSFSKEAFQVHMYRERVLVSYEMGKRKAWAYGVFIGVVGLFAYLAISLVLWMGGRMVIRKTDDLSSNELVSFLLYTLNLAASLGGLSELYSTLLNALGASQRMFGILDLDPTIGSRARALQENPAKPAARVTEGRVEFVDVCFSYPTRADVPVLKGVSFRCEPGTVNAFCGHSGGGKSTIISLTQRFYDTSSGAILIDGVNIKDMDTLELRRHMACVSQEPALFACSIADNIAYGVDRAVSRKEVEEAARKANALEFIESFPDKFDTMVGERGIQLSGGQKQRVAIARAILVNPTILLLDEASSALDSESEAKVQSALEKLMQNKTVFVVAHRLSTIKDASVIFVLDEGAVAERGTYDELVAIPNGVFAGLAARQIRSG